MEYKVIINPQAEKELDTVYDYFIENYSSFQAVNNLAEKFEKFLSTVAFMPQSFPKFLNRYHKFLIGNYAAIYSINEEDKIVYILKFVYAKMDLSKLDI